MDCHTTQPTDLADRQGNHVFDASQYRQSGTGMCASCHGDEYDGHKVGDEVDYEVPADLALTVDNKISCLTCHHVHGSLASDRPWASVSLMDRLTQSERMSKTYLLRRNNVNGELCLICHGGSGEK
jgi:cytochrome c553